MRNAGRRIANAFGFIGEVFDDLSYVEDAWNACGRGDSLRETINEAIRTYKCEVEKMNEKVEKLERKYMQVCVQRR